MLYQYPDGSVVPENRMVFVDNVTGTFTISVRSLKPVTAEQIKRLIERQFEVTAITEVEQVAICKRPLQDTAGQTLQPAS